jgi:hypothetical protein
VVPGETIECCAGARGQTAEIQRSTDDPVGSSVLILSTRRANLCQVQLSVNAAGAGRVLQKLTLSDRWFERRG